MTRFMGAAVQQHLRRRPMVIALHCWGASGRQWSPLAKHLGEEFNVIAPNLLGRTTPWHGDDAFRLADEAAPLIALIDTLRTPVHLVGHSYGGAVALRIARERPRSVASLSLYEPVAFHVLKSAGPGGWSAFNQVRALASDIAKWITAGAYRKAAARLVDYWGGEGTWERTNETAQAKLAGHAASACLCFNAALDEPTPLVAYRHFRFPSLLLKGQPVSETVSLIADRLLSVVRPVRVEEIPGAGHMGPLTHAPAVSAAIAAHIVTAGKSYGTAE